MNTIVNQTPTPLTSAFSSKLRLLAAWTVVAVGLAGCSKPQSKLSLGLPHGSQQGLQRLPTQELADRYTLFNGHWSSLLSSANNAIRINPSDFGAWYMRARAHYYLGDFLQAQQDCDRALVYSDDTCLQNMARMLRANVVRKIKDRQEVGSKA
jgi:tetratricopeptide (TPR) repeat protein